jgi:hypothetical protein
MDWLLLNFCKYHIPIKLFGLYWKMIIKYGKIYKNEEKFGKI